MHIFTSGVAEQRKPVLTMPTGVCFSGRISYCHSCIIANTPAILRKLMLFSFLTAISKMPPEAMSFKTLELTFKLHMFIKIRLEESTIKL